MSEFYYIVEEILEFDYEGNSSITRFLTYLPQVAFTWIKDNPIVHDPESCGNLTFYTVTVYEECPPYILQHYKELL
jgi:hypothetical protein